MKRAMTNFTMWSVSSSDFLIIIIIILEKIIMFNNKLLMNKINMIALSNGN